MSGPTCSACGAPLAPSQARRFGATCPDCVIKFAADESFPEFPNLRIVGRIGRGGMGVVYEAEQPQLGRRVALKVLSPHLAFDERFMTRFQAEARTLAQLQHPNIVTVFDVGVHGGLPYILLERVEGYSLRKILADGPMKPVRALEIAAAVFDALGCAHERGIVHRDIKPENILIDGQGRVKLADFGLAKPPQSRRAADSGRKLRVGTLRYMAPEQLDQPDRVDARADLYSAGLVLLEMLTGKPPQEESEKASIPRRAPKGVQGLLRRLLATDPARRIGSADEARKAVESLLDPGPRRRRRR